MPEAAVELRGAGKRFPLYGSPRERLADAFGLARLFGYAPRDFWALRGIDLSVARGERLGIMGRNGAGKSTLLKLVTGNAAPSEGSVVVRGRVHALLELGTGFHPDFSGRENLRAALSLGGTPAEELPGLEREIEEFAELGEFLDRPVRTYSSGMYARLAFAVSTAASPDLVVIDEVFAAGDAYFAGRCVRRLRAMTGARGATVLFVSHDPSAVVALCDRAVWLDRGRIRMDGAPLDVVRAYAQAVRAEEAQERAARAMRVPRGAVAGVCPAPGEGGRAVALYRFVAADPASLDASGGTIRAVALLSGGRAAAELAIGWPGDNDPNAAARILDDPGFMDWAPPERDAAGAWMRAVRPGSGRFAHAPFTLPEPPDGAPCPELLVRAAAAAALAVERYDPATEAYVRLGLINAGESRFPLPAVAPAPSPAADAAAPADAPPVDLPDRHLAVYGAGGARITGVTLRAGDADPEGILFCHEPFRIELSFEAAAPLPDPVFAFCAYLPAGPCACQWLVAASEMGRDAVERGTVIFSGAPLLLGRGDYVASAAIFKTRPAGDAEPEAWQVLDRAIRFRVDDRLPVDRVDYGICRQPVKAALRDG